MPEAFVPATKEQYHDDDLVYVDPRERIVIGLVEWSNSGRPKPLAMKRWDEEVDDADEAGRRRKRPTRSYPWGTYRSMKRVFKVAGKIFEAKPPLSLDDAILLCLREPFWDLPAQPAAGQSV